MAGSTSFPPDAILRIDAQMADLLKDQAAASSSADAEAVRGSLLIGNRNAANGFAGLNSSANFEGQVGHRIMTTAALDTEVGLVAGELIWETDSLGNHIGYRVMNGVAGGITATQPIERIYVRPGLVIANNTMTHVNVDIPTGVWLLTISLVTGSYFLGDGVQFSYKHYDGVGTGLPFIGTGFVRTVSTGAFVSSSLYGPVQSQALTSGQGFVANHSGVIQVGAGGISYAIGTIAATGIFFGLSNIYIYGTRLE